jgi:hypothetical protein
MPNRWPALEEFCKQHNLGFVRFRIRLETLPIRFRLLWALIEDCLLTSNSKN